MHRAASAVTATGQASPHGRLRRVGESCLWLLVIGAAVVATLWLASVLRLVVLPVFLALVLAALLTPPAGWLRRRGFPAALAALLVLVGSIVLLGGLFAAVVPNAIDEVSELDVQLAGGLDEVQDWLQDGPLALSDTEISQAIDNAQSSLRENISTVSQQAVVGAFLVAEVLTGLALALVILFFLLKDGREMWRWVLGLVPSDRRDTVDRAGEESWGALAGFLRGQTIVALFDSVFIALALLIIGVPLVLPLALLVFFGAYVPVLGATIAGVAAALVALFALGPLEALLVVAAILGVQQVEGNVLQPYVVGRATHVHPVAVLLAITAGGVLAGIIGIMVAAPLVAVAAAILRSLREPEEGDDPEGAEASDAGGGGESGAESMAGAGGSPADA